MILSFLRTLILYLILILSIRMMGKRQIGQMEASEFVVTMLVANLASIPMQDAAIPLYSGLVPILTVLGLELVLSGLILHSVLIRKIFCGKPVILIDNGRILQENLRRARVTLNELMGHIREKDALDISTVQYAILETDGTLTVFPFPSCAPPSAEDCGLPVKQQQLPVTIIEDGYLFREDLKRVGKDERWLQEVLSQRGTDIPGTLLLTLTGPDQILWIGKESA